jgi:hypothetical protein
MFSFNLIEYVSIHKIKKVVISFMGCIEYRSLEDVQVRALACSLDNASLRLFVTSLPL